MPRAGDDEEEDLAPMYMAVAEIRHVSSACMDLSPFAKNMFHRVFHVREQVFHREVGGSTFAFDGEWI